MAEQKLVEDNSACEAAIFSNTSSLLDFTLAIDIASLACFFAAFCPIGKAQDAHS